MKHLFLLLLLLLPVAAMGQNKKSEPLFEKAVDKSVAKQYEEAIKLLEKAVDIDPAYVEAWLVLGNQQMALQRYTDAADSYQHALDLQPRSQRWQQEGREGLALAQWRQQAIENPVPFRPINLGANINTEDDEYLPALTADYRMLVFTRRSPRNAQTQRGLDMEEDFYYSNYDTMSLDWGPAHRMPEPLNSHGNEGAQTISHDGRVVVFTACGRGDHHTGCDIYMSVRHGGRWGKPRNLGAPVNTVYWESFPSLSIDGFTTSGAAPSRRVAGASPATWVPLSTRRATRQPPISISTTARSISPPTAIRAWGAWTSLWLRERATPPGDRHATWATPSTPPAKRTTSSWLPTGARPSSAATALAATVGRISTRL